MPKLKKKFFLTQKKNLKKIVTSQITNNLKGFTNQDKKIKMADVDHELTAIRFVVVSHILRVIDEFRIE